MFKRFITWSCNTSLYLRQRFTLELSILSDCLISCMMTITIMYLQAFWIYFKKQVCDLELYKLYFSRFGAKLWNEMPQRRPFCSRSKSKNSFFVLHLLTRSERPIIIHIKEYIHRQPLWKRSIDTPSLLKKVKSTTNVKKRNFLLTSFYFY